MSFKIQSANSVRHDEGAILCAIIGGMVGALLLYEVVRGIRFLTIEYLSINPQDFKLSLIAGALMVVVGAILGGMLGYGFGLRLMHLLGQTIQDTADEAVRHRRRQDGKR